MKIQQLLHGYQDGHGRLAGSIQNLTPGDSARISQMSDWSGYRDPLEKDHSYITAYPLKDSSYYIVAKSWYASEMERPGCVWTHSLLIDTLSIDSQFDFRVLAKLFQRPVRGEYGRYNKSIEINLEEDVVKTWEGMKPDEVSLMFLLNTIVVGEETFYLKVEQESWWNQHMCLTFLQFLPLGMLKRITLSSGASNPRKMENQLFSMQFVTMSEGISLVSPPWAERLTSNDFNAGLQFIAKAMTEDEEDVSALIKVFSSDIQSDGKKYIGTCLLMAMLYQGIKKETEISYRDILGTLVTYYPDVNEGDLVKVNFLGRKISELFCSSEVDYLYQIAIFEDGDKHFSERQLALWKRVSEIAASNSEAYLQMIESLAKEINLNAYGREILTDCFGNLSDANFSEVSDSLWEKLLPYLKDNNDFLFSERWLTMKGSRFNDVLWVFQKIENDGYQFWPQLLDAIMTNHSFVDSVFVDTLYGKIENYTQRVLDFLNLQNSEKWRGYLYIKAFHQTRTFVDWLSKQEWISDAVETMTVLYVNPDDEYVSHSDSGIWQWLIKKDDGKKDLSYYIFLLIMAYQWQGQDAINGFYHCFDKVHKALGAVETSDRVWQYVSRYSGKVYFFQEWDRCRKLRNGVVAHAKSMGWGKSILEKFTPDQKLNETLAVIFDR